jgi:hypothetical protein
MKKEAGMGKQDINVADKDADKQRKERIEMGKQDINVAEERITVRRKAKAKAEKKADLSNLSGYEFDEWIREKLGFGWTGMKDKFGNRFAYRISPFDEQRLVRPDGKILQFSKDEDELTKEENKIYSKVFKKIVDKLENAVSKNGVAGIAKLTENFAENSAFFSYLNKTIK